MATTSMTASSVKPFHGIHFGLQSAEESPVKLEPPKEKSPTGDPAKPSPPKELPPKTTQPPSWKYTMPPVEFIPNVMRHGLSGAARYGKMPGIQNPMSILQAFGTAPAMKTPTPEDSPVARLIKQLEGLPRHEVLGLAKQNAVKKSVMPALKFLGARYGVYLPGLTDSDSTVPVIVRIAGVDVGSTDVKAAEHFQNLQCNLHSPVSEAVPKPGEGPGFGKDYLAKANKLISIPDPYDRTGEGLAQAAKCHLELLKLRERNRKLEVEQARRHALYKVIYEARYEHLMVEIRLAVAKLQHVLKDVELDMFEHFKSSELDGFIHSGCSVYIARELVKSYAKQ